MHDALYQAVTALAGVLEGRQYCPDQLPERVSQCGASTVQARLDRLPRHPQRLGDLRSAQTLHVTQHEHRPVSDWQLVDGGREHALELLAQRLLLRIPGC